MALRFAFFGTPPFAAEILAGLLARGLTPVLIATQPPRGHVRSRGRPGLGSGVVTWAARHCPEIPLAQPQKASNPEFIAELARLDLDLIAVAAYGQLLVPALLDLPRFGCLNVHTSLLPKFRGAAPIQRAILSGQDTTGVTIMFMAPKLDAGDIALQAKHPIAPNATAGDLEGQLATIGGELLVEALRTLERGEGLPRRAQLEVEATFAPKWSKEEGLISWRETAIETHRRIRAATPQPGAWGMLHLRTGVKRIALAQSYLLEEGAEGRPLSADGRFQIDNRGLIARCSDAPIGIGRILIEGKGWMSGGEFASGYRHLLD